MMSTKRRSNRQLRRYRADRGLLAEMTPPVDFIEVARGCSSVALFAVLC
jgi:hypothetical protein